MQTVDISYIEPFLVDPAIVDWDNSNAATDFGKRSLEILAKFRDSPRLVTDSDIERLCTHERSPVGGFGEGFSNHLKTVAAVNRDISRIILDRHPNANVADPKDAYGDGLVHDLPVIVRKVEDGYNNPEKELPLLPLGVALGIPRLAYDVAVHDAYWEILEMIREGRGFPQVELYSEWTRALNDSENPLNFYNLHEEFGEHLEGRDKLSLMALTVADSTSGELPYFCLETFDADFKARRAETDEKYYHGPKREGKPLTALGIATMERGGKQRIELYRNIIRDFLHGRGEEHIGIPGLWRDSTA